MNRRLLPFAFAFAPAVLAYACSSSDDGGGGGTDTDAGSSETGPGTDTSTNDDAAVTDGAKKDNFVPATGNPLEGLGAVTAVGNLNFPVEGPQWVTDSIYVSNLNKAVIKFTPTMPLVGTGGQGDNPIEHYLSASNGVATLGNAIDDSVKSPTPTLLTLEVNNGAPGASIFRTPFTGTFPRTGTALTLVLDAGGGAFDSPNDLVVRKSDGTIYMTDPAYQSTGVTTNHIWRLKPTAVGTDYEVFEIQLAGQPNGIALSPDNKTLFVSLTGPAGGPPPPTPRIEKYTVNADGSLGAAMKFADVPPAPTAGMPETGSLADGLAVDTAGNVYVAVKNGVDVFKADGLSKWGHINTATVANGVAFGDADKKTLYITTQGGLFKVAVKVAGLGN